MEEKYKKLMDVYDTLFNCLKGELKIEILFYLSKNVYNILKKEGNHAEPGGMPLINFLDESLKRMELSKNPSLIEVLEKIKIGEIALSEVKPMRISLNNNNSYFI